MDIYLGAHRCPVVKGSGVAQIHVDTAMTHRVAEVVVPIGSMDGIGPIEVHHRRHAR